MWRQRGPGLAWTRGTGRAPGPLAGWRRISGTSGGARPRQWRIPRGGIGGPLRGIRWRGVHLTVDQGPLATVSWVIHCYRVFVSMTRRACIDTGTLPDTASAPIVHDLPARD